MIHTIQNYNKIALQFVTNISSQPSPLTKIGFIIAFGLTSLHFLNRSPKIPLSPGAKTWKQIHNDGSYGASEKGEINQRLYNLWFAQTVQKTKDILRSTKNPGIESVLTTIGNERSRIALELHHSEALRFGRWRCSSEPVLIDRRMWVTYILKNSRYHKYFITFNALLDKNDKNWIQFEGRLPYREKPIPLSAMHKFGELQVIHPPHVNTDALIQDVLHHLDDTMQTILQDKSISQDKLLACLAHIHWWLAQLMLFERGSAAITEVLIQAIAAAKGFPNSHWEKGILPDLEAISHSEEDFIAAFPTFLILT